MLELLKKRSFAAKLQNALASDRFFAAVIVFLVLESAWLALTGLFPMAYDEGTHFDVIRLYAHHISPFWSAQPDGPATYGAMSRDLSYMYQYLMSFVYRLLDLFFKSDTPKIITLRLISVAMMAATVVLYRRLLLKTKASKALVHSVLAIFVLIPTVPFLAAQINYDNLMLLMSGVLLLLTVRINAAVRKDEGSIRDVLLFLVAGMFTCLVKYPYAPVFAVLVLWVAFVYVRHVGGVRRAVAGLPKAAVRSFIGLGRWTRVGLAVVVIVMGGLFFERYGLNTIKYGTPVPECDQVLDTERCLDYGPWRRNYLTYQDKISGKLAPVKLDPFSFTFRTWFPTMGTQFFYALNGPAGGYSVGAPLPLPLTLEIIAVVVCLPLCLVYWRRLIRVPLAKGFFVLSGVYMFSLWAQNYSDFLHLHIATAIQARYLVMVVPFALFFGALALSYALKDAVKVKTGLVAVALLVLLTQGGGIGVYVLRSDDSWYWPNRAVSRVNWWGRDVLEKIVIGKGFNP